MNKKNKESKAWGIASLVLGILSIIFFRSEFVAFIFGSASITSYFIQKKKGPTKLALAGLIIGVLGTYHSLTPVLDYLRIKLPVFILFIVTVAAIIIRKLLANKKINIKKWLKWLLIIGGSVIAVITIMFIIILIIDANTPTNCKTKDCFIREAKQCDDAVLEITEDIGTIRYESQKIPEYLSTCSMKKIFVKLHESESQAMKDLLEGRSVTCEYRKGDFNEDWVNSLVKGIEDCRDTGGLKEAIGKLIIFAE